MKKWILKESKSILWVLSPFIVPISLVILFSGVCVDSWCVYVIPLLWKSILISVITVVIMFLILRRYSINFKRAGIATWLIHFEVILLLVIFSQFYEGDKSSGVFACGMFIILAIFIFKVLRRKKVNDEK